MKLGLVTQPPNGSCSRAYVEGGTHKFTADGVIFYHKGMLPGEQAHFVSLRLQSVGTLLGRIERGVLIGKVS